MLSCCKKTSISKKAVMAVTGLLLILFVIGHLLGNLCIFGGPDLLNSYAYHLESLGPLLWAVRVTLLLIVSLHILTAVQLTLENRKARPVPYQHLKPIVTTYAARTMALSGFIVLFYLIFHLLHFTFRVTHPSISHGIDAQGHRDVYSLMVLSFRDPLLSLFYVFAMALLSMHLSHGFKSLFQSLGLNNEKLNHKLERLSVIIAVLIFAGYSSIPLAVLFGLVKPAGGLL